MCKRKFTDKIKASTGCVRETPQIKRSQHGMCWRYSSDQNNASMGYVGETPQWKIKAALDV